ncbi:alpha/beta hydrolase family protein [Actinomadura formosensis]|uniref:alpha/beta hydrolase family protein n=1 Tax=Actinomadura formosensis TaxID=60706 RepID=UPI00082CFA03|nr:alpha/beta hydrolase [Actinomadura formosensis]
MRKRIWVSLLTVLVVIAGAGGWVIYQHDYDLREEKVTITGGEQPLRGVLAMPEHGHGPYGLVVFVHGDGPVDATADGFYRPIWEAMARAGYASLSWNKPGVGGAPGNWLHQSMRDRAEETVAAIEWAKRRSDIDRNRIGLWGGSQAGWVMPKAARLSPDVKFLIAVSPAINWLRQGRYNLLAELRARNASPSRVKAQLAESDRMRRALGNGQTYEQYRAAGGDVSGISRDRWTFITKNYTSDASADLAALRVPVLLILAGHDINVDVADTEAGYRHRLRMPGQLRILRYPAAVHSLMRKDIEDSSFKTYVTAIATPRALFVPGFLRDQRRYLEEAER